MRILVISDIHCRLQNLEKILDLAQGSFEKALILGDLTNHGDCSQGSEVLELLNGLEIMALPGNLDTPQVLKLLEGRGISMHNKTVQLGGFSFAGFGGGLVGSIGEMLYTEGEIEKSIRAMVEGIENTILATHLPPANTKIDQNSAGGHIGSEAVKKCIEKFQPALHLCGHCHDAPGEVRIGKTTSINIGAVKEGRALLLELGKKISWKRLALGQ